MICLFHFIAAKGYPVRISGNKRNTFSVRVLVSFYILSETITGNRVNDYDDFFIYSRPETPMDENCKWLLKAIKAQYK